MLQFGRPPNRVDFPSQIGSVSFADAWRRRSRQRLRLGARSIPLPVIGLRDLLRSKRDAGRLKDLDDIEHLEAIARARRK